MSVVKGIAGLFIGLTVLASCSNATADASPGDCEHREIGHILKHGGQLEDDRFHLAHGERVTCGDGQPEQRREPEQRHDDAGKHDEPKDQEHHRHNKWWRND